MISIVEAINLAVSILLFIVYRFYAKEVFEIVRTKKLKFFIRGIHCFVISLVATILEGLFFYNFFNLIEHIFYTCAAVMFVIAVKNFQAEE